MYDYLFSPLKLGPITLSNRIIFSAHLTNYAVDQLPTDQHVKYYQARANGGAGLIITEEHSVHPTDWPYEKLIHGFDKKVIEGYRAITNAVHAHGTPIFAQINHNGSQASGMYSRRAVWGASPIYDPLFREVPHEVTEDEIFEVIDGYANVAKNAIEGGFDGIELQCSHSSIVRCFLSGATNHRSDRWGGDLQNRSRLMLEIIDRVRATIGPDKALGVRICGDELIEGGMRIDEAVEVAKAVDATKSVDYINSSIGVATASLFAIEASMAIPPGYSLFIPSAIRKEVSIPVVGVGRFKDPLQADKAIALGHCDLVGVVRGQIADPDFANKAKGKDLQAIRYCLSCNQECVGRMGLNRWLGCIENPNTGREATPEEKVNFRSKAKGQDYPKVAIIGAGPAGLQAAISLSQAGAIVALIEASPNPGGQILLGASLPARNEIGDLVRNQLNALRELGVEITTNTKITEDDLAELNADAIVVASGSSHNKPYWISDYQGSDEDQMSISDVNWLFEKRVQPKAGETAIIFDELGFHQATSAATYLLDRGVNVVFITPSMVIAQDLGVTLDLELWRASMAGRNITFLRNTLGTHVAQKTLGTLNHIIGKTDSIYGDHLFLATHRRSNNELYHHALQAKIPAIAIGDALSPRRAHSAILEGQRAPQSLALLLGESRSSRLGALR
ncbi:mycofactocin system FadH/OYE family oxidoreductase 2 [Acidithrix sp. C25]|uniref:mycofactocin system FadH/OYE family oxidoreductase 2 n=1 Tax=Acidithrix sp. C25 TaxID=1671482 RepID=UPI00191BBF00|nr:mycofactocin system FadH/OYE family oxidoreductase 2 [Acidithrix sp. C25]